MKTHTIFPFLRLRASLINKGSKYLLLFCFSAHLLFCFSSVSAQQLINNKGNRNQSYPVITEVNPEIVALINQVSQDSIENHIRYMQQFHRVASSPEALVVQNWLVDKFESYGYEDVKIHYFNYNSQQLDAGNVVVVKKGTEFPDEYIMVTSHYDHSTGTNVSGPGADDNASGTAGVLECARLLKDYDTKRSLIFVPFNAEEFWLVGSMPFAQKCASENKNIIAHFNMDMIGWFPPDSTNTIMASGYSYISKALFEYYQQTANTYIPDIPTIRFSRGDQHGDNTPFNVYEFQSLYIGDVEYIYENPCYHKLCDTLGDGVNRLDLAKTFVQAVLSATAELANAWLPPQNLSACSGTDKITVSWENDSVSSSYKIFKNNVLLDETFDNYYEDYDVEVGKKYEYFVIAINGTTGQASAPSNKDEVAFVAPLRLPYFNDFKTDKYGFEQSDWVLRKIVAKSALCNTNTLGSFPDNYLSIAELNWFSIPDSIENISIRFKWRGKFIGVVYNLQNWFPALKKDWSNVGMWFEITTDRKTWNKLAYISGNNDKWIDYEFSLNNYIGSDFFQARFRLESCGSQSQGDYYIKLGYITDIQVAFNDGNDIKKYALLYIKDLIISPNPTTAIVNITTFQENDYQICVYDMMGKLLFQQDTFRDGSLDLSFLAKGTYLIVASLPKHRVAKKLVKN